MQGMSQRWEWGLGPLEEQPVSRTAEQPLQDPACLYLASCVWVVLAGMPMHHVCPVLAEARKWDWIPWKWSCRGWVLKINPASFG